MPPRPAFRPLPVLVALSVALVACHRPAENSAAKGRPAGVPVTLAEVTQVAWDRSVPIIGTLYPKDTATLAAEVEGVVERTTVDFGDRVKADQLLATIDTGSYEAQLAQQAGNVARAEASQVVAKQNFERVRNLGQAAIASAADLDQAQAALAQAEAELKAAHGAEAIARLNLKRSQILAPFDGGISQRFATKGDFVKTGEALYELVNDAVLKFIFAVPERYASYVEKRLPVSFSVDNYPGETFTGSVYLISPSVATASRSFNVGALVTNTNFRLKANTFARGTLVLERGVPTPVVPLESVISFAGVTKVFTVVEGKAVGRTVKVGRIREGRQEILDGVKVGEQVVLSGVTQLTDGTAVVPGGGKGDHNPAADGGGGHSTGGGGGPTNAPPAHSGAKPHASRAHPGAINGGVA